MMPFVAATAFFVSQSLVNILYQPKVGTTYKHLMTMTQSAQGTENSTQMTVTSKVLAFEDGNYKVESVSNTKVGSGAANPLDGKSNITYVDQQFNPKLEP